MLTGRAELLIQALSLIPPTTRYDTLNHQGLTALMIASVRNDEAAIQTLLDAGADPNIEVPSVTHPNCPAIHPETQHWTAVTFAACKGNYQALRILLERGAHVEGGARLSEDKCTLTPLQVASGGGVVEVVSLLLAHGAHAFLSTQLKDSLCFSGSAQRGCYRLVDKLDDFLVSLKLTSLYPTVQSPWQPLMVNGYRCESYCPIHLPQAVGKCSRWRKCSPKGTALAAASWNEANRKLHRR